MKKMRALWQRVVRIATMPHYVMGDAPLEAINAPRTRAPHSAPEDDACDTSQAWQCREGSDIRS